MDKPRRHPFLTFIRWIFILGVLAVLGLATYLTWLPDIAALRDHNPTTTAFIELRKAQAERKGQTLKIHMQWKNLDEISPYLAHAVILSEDDTFYQHHGFDWVQMQEAVRRDWEKKRFVYGGSTITQQLARTLFLSPRKDLFRKAKEAAITWKLERELSKKRILELYLNSAEWGNGIFGAEAAAQFYFGVPASALDTDQSVALASILPSPRRWSPVSERNFMARRRSQLGQRMQAAGFAPPPLILSSTTPEGLDSDDSDDATVSPASL